MKVETEISIQAAPEKVWAILSDFAAYPEWNPFIHAVRGDAAPEAQLDMDMAYSTGYGRPPKKVMEKVTVTGWAAPKYFSWVWNHGFGSWWLSAEHVFRLKPREDGKVLFFHEAYYTGLSIAKVLGFLDMLRDAQESKVKPSMLKMNEALKERAEAA